MHGHLNVKVVVCIDVTKWAQLSDEGSIHFKACVMTVIIIFKFFNHLFSVLSVVHTL